MSGFTKYSFERNEEMKKALIILLAAVLLTGCTGYNNLTSLTENGFCYHISSNGKEAIVVYYEWDGQEDTAVIRHGDDLRYRADKRTVPVSANRN